MAIMQNAIQLNVRIAAAVGKAHKLATEVADENLNGMTEAALCFFYGSTSPSVLAMQKKAVQAAKQLEKGTKLPFNIPLTPFSNNALTAA